MNLVLAVVGLLDGEFVKLGGEVVGCSSARVPACVDGVGGSMANGVRLSRAPFIAYARKLAFKAFVALRGNVPHDATPPVDRA